MSHTAHRIFALSLVAALLGMAATGCMQTYYIRSGHWLAAEDARARGIDAKNIAVPAQEPSGKPRALRLHRLPPPVALLTPGLGQVRVSDGKAQRAAGTTLFVLGLAHWIVIAGQIGAAATSHLRCTYPCMNEGYSLLFTGPILGTAGLSLLIPGITLMAKGFGAPTDIAPGRPGILYVGESLPR